MKRQLVIAGLLALTCSANAADSNHLISIGTDGFGWSGAANVLKWDEEKSGIKDNKESSGSLEFNYAYIFDNGFMLGVSVSNETEKDETKVTTGEKITEESSDTSLAIVLGYNFSQNLNESWWIKSYLGTTSAESETKDGTDPTNDNKVKGDGSIFALEVGKRFTLSKWGLSNVTYSPSIRYSSTSFGGDFKDAGLESRTGFELNVLKFDVLF